MRSAYRFLSRAVLCAVAAQIALTSLGVFWDEHSVEHGKALDDDSYMNNAGFGIEWLVGHAIVPLLAIALLVAAFRAGVSGGVRRSLLILAAAILTVVLGAVAAKVPALGILYGLNLVALLGLAGLAARDAAPLDARAPGIPVG